MEFSLVISLLLALLSAHLTGNAVVKLELELELKFMLVHCYLLTLRAQIPRATPWLPTGICIICIPW